MIDIVCESKNTLNDITNENYSAIEKQLRRIQLIFAKDLGYYEV